MGNNLKRSLIQKNRKKINPSPNVMLLVVYKQSKRLFFSDPDALYALVNSHLEKENIENNLNNYRANYDLTATKFEKANARRQSRSWQVRRKRYRDLFIQCKNYEEFVLDRDEDRDNTEKREEEDEQEQEHQEEEESKKNKKELNPYLEQMQQQAKIEQLDQPIPPTALQNYQGIVRQEIRRIRNLNRQKVLLDAVKSVPNSTKQKELLKEYIILLAFNSKCLFEPPVQAEYKRWEGVQAFRRLLRLQGSNIGTAIAGAGGDFAPSSSPPSSSSPFYEKLDCPHEAEALALEAAASLRPEDIFPNVDIYTTEKNQILNITHSICEEDSTYPLQEKLEEFALLCNGSNNDGSLGVLEKKEEEQKKKDLIREIMLFLIRNADRSDWRATMGIFGHLDPLEMTVQGWEETSRLCDEVEQPLFISAASSASSLEGNGKGKEGKGGK